LLLLLLVFLILIFILLILPAARSGIMSTIKRRKITSKIKS